MSRRMLLPLLLVSLLTAGVAGAAGEELLQLRPGFKPIPAMLLLATLALYLGIGIYSRVTSTSGYWVAGRGVGEIGNGAALAADWLSTASFMGVAGLLFLKGWFGLGYILGWTGGFVLLLVLLATPIRRFGKYTIPEFLGDRFDSHAVRLMAAGVTVLISLTYATAQFKGIGLVCAWIFGMNYTTSVLFAAGIVCAYLLVSGMTGTTRNQQLQYLVLCVAFLLPLWILVRKAGAPGIVPQMEYGRILSAVLDGQVADGRLAGAPLEALQRAFLPWGNGNIFQFIALVFTLMVGTAGLPHILVRFYTVRSEQVARKSVFWGLLFISLLYWSSPVYATLGTYWNPQGGKEVADLIILSAPERAGLGPYMLGLLAAGALAAGLSTVAGVMIAGAGAIAHDWYASYLRPQSSDRQRLLAGRVATLALCGLVVLAALHPPALIAQIVAMAFALAGNTLFPACVLAVWSSRSNRYGALAGMVWGAGMTLLAMSGWIFGIPAFGPSGWLAATSSALVICPLAFLVNLTVSRLTARRILPASHHRADRILRTLHRIPESP